MFESRGPTDIDSFEQKTGIENPYVFQGVLHRIFGKPEARPSPEKETWNRILVVSNRLPFKVIHDANGAPLALPTDGGLVTAMSPLLREGVGGKWIGWPGTDEEEGLEEALRSKANGSFDFGVVNLTAKEKEEYYDGFSNKVLCPLFGGEIEQIDFENLERYWVTYKGVQKKFAEKIHSDLTENDIIWIQDYHLTGVGTELAKMGVQQPIGYFLHMPFPTSENFALLPHKEELLKNFLDYDMLGFQTENFKNNFLKVLTEMLPEAKTEKISPAVTLVHIGEKTIRVGNFPVSIDAEEFITQAEAPATKEYAAELNSVLRNNGEIKMIFNAGRLDYTKGFYEELLAFDRLLEKHPELIGKILLYQLVFPGRESIPAYSEYKEKITALARQINNKYRATILHTNAEEQSDTFQAYEGMPIRQVHANMERTVYLAHLQVADILSIPTKADGMNLVSKEGAVAGKPTMVQILGEAAGSVEELGEYALTIDPRDTESFADTLYTACTMEEYEMRERKSQMAEVVKTHDVFRWWSEVQGPTFQEVWNEKRLLSKDDANSTRH